MISSVLALQAKPGAARAVEELYRDRGIIERSLRFPGCRGSVLLRSSDDGPASHLVIAEWDDAEAYARWVADPWRAAVSTELAELLETPPGAVVVARLYEPVPLTPEEHS
jgi:heme-degrading monooxygenase HmoA